jgi:hypothetical protein
VDSLADPETVESSFIIYDLGENFDVCFRRHCYGVGFQCWQIKVRTVRYKTCNLNSVLPLLRVCQSCKGASQSYVRDSIKRHTAERA